MARININGKTIQVDGALSLVNGKWYDGNGREIDMNNLEEVKEAKTINITIEGNIERLNVDHCNSVVVNGDCKKIKTISGDITCGDVDGDAETVSGDINCDIVHGDAKTVSGNIRSSEIKGKTSTTTGKVNGERSGKRSSCGSVNIDGIFGSVFGSTSSEITMGDVISGGVIITRSVDGKKHMTLTKDCAVNGRRIGDMSESELQAWIDAMAKKNKIVTIR